MGSSGIIQHCTCAIKPLRIDRQIQTQISFIVKDDSCEKVQFSSLVSDAKSVRFENGFLQQFLYVMTWLCHRLVPRHPQNMFQPCIVN